MHTKTTLSALLALAATAHAQVGPDPATTVSFGRGGEDQAELAASGSALFAGKPSYTAGVVGSARIWERGASANGWIPEGSVGGTAGQGLYGLSVDVAGDRAIVGAPGEAYVYERDAAGSWVEVVKLVPSAPVGNYGDSVALDGDLAAVGEPLTPFSYGAGAVHIYERAGSGAWNEAAVHYGGGGGGLAPLYGTAVDVSGDRVVVGGFLVDIYVRDLGGPGAWGLEQTVGGGVPQVNIGESLSIEGDVLAAGDPRFNGQGSVYLYERTGGAGGPWTLQAFFGSGAASADGYAEDVALGSGRLFVGSHRIDNPGAVAEGAVFVYSRPAGSWALETTLRPPAGTLDVTYGRRLAADGPVLYVREDGRPLGPDKLSGLALDETTGLLFGIDPATEFLVEVDPATGATSVLAKTDTVQVEGLAYDSASGVLYASDSSTDELLTIDPATGAATVVGPTGFDRLRGLAFASTTGVLYGADDATDQLIALDTSTGAGTAIGPLGFSSVRGLAFDASTGTLYATDKAGTKSLFSVNPSTGAGTAIGPTGYFELRALAAHPAGGLLVAADQPADAFEPRELATLDVTTGAGTPLSTFNPDPTVPNEGRVIHVYEDCGSAVGYCTAGTSASGCQASVSALGTASGTAPSGFTLTVTDLEGAKDGQFFWGTSGRQANAWGNGTSLNCVVPPTTRGGLLAGSGSPGTCDGSASQDLAALWTSTPTKNPGAGSVVQVQYWYRDPQSTSNRTTSLSNALEFAVCP